MENQIQMLINEQQAKVARLQAELVAEQQKLANLEASAEAWTKAESAKAKIEEGERELKEAISQLPPEIAAMFQNDGGDFNLEQVLVKPTPTGFKEWTLMDKEEPFTGDFIEEYLGYEIWATTQGNPRTLTIYGKAFYGEALNSYPQTQVAIAEDLLAIAYQKIDEIAAIHPVLYWVKDDSEYLEGEFWEYKNYRVYTDYPSPVIQDGECSWNALNDALFEVGKDDIKRQIDILAFHAENWIPGIQLIERTIQEIGATTLSRQDIRTNLGLTKEQVRKLLLVMKEQGYIDWIAPNGNLTETFRNCQAVKLTDDELEVFQRKLSSQAGWLPIESDYIADMKQWATVEDKIGDYEVYLRKGEGQSVTAIAVISDTAQSWAINEYHAHWKYAVSAAKDFLLDKATDNLGDQLVSQIQKQIEQIHQPVQPNDIELEEVKLEEVELEEVELEEVELEEVELEEVEDNSANEEILRAIAKIFKGQKIDRVGKETLQIAASIVGSPTEGTKEEIADGIRNSDAVKNGSVASGKFVFPGKEVKKA